MSKIDCLVCHDRTGSYQKAPTRAGMPDPKVDLTYVAKSVGATSRRTCGACHFSGGGGDAVKHGDMSTSLYWPNRNCDVHMADFDFQCTECHRTRNHKISNGCTSTPWAKRSPSCEDCHTDKPHYGDTLLDHHLNRHGATIDCNTCHSPLYSKCAPTKIWWDWSTAGDKKRKTTKDKFGKELYDWKKGTSRWDESAKPVYAWFNGYESSLLMGDEINPGAMGFKSDNELTYQEKQNLIPTSITSPVGSIKDPRSKITPFKVMKGIQPADARHRYLLVPHLFPYDEADTVAYWKNLDWQLALIEGAAKAGLPYSGEQIWIATVMYWRIEHEVMPKEFALSCVQCHESLQGDKTCDRCHQDDGNVNFPELSNRGTDFHYLLRQGRDVGDLIGKTDYIDFKQLGYKGDPIIYGGRFKKLPLGSREKPVR